MKNLLNVLITWHDIINNINDFNEILKKNKIRYDLLRPKQKIEEKTLLKIIHKYDGVICGDDQFTEAVLSKADKLKVISKWGTGIDSIDLKAAKKNKVKVLNVKNAFTTEVATYAVGALISLSRNFFQANHSLYKAEWKKFQGSSLLQKNIGIIGFGRIGKEIHRLLKPFNLNTFVSDIDPTIKKSKKKLKVKFVSTNKILQTCHFIIIATDLNKKSYKLLNFKNLKLIKKKPIIINIARGLVIDQEALVYALKRKIISKVALDVFNQEPIKKNNKLLKFSGNFYSAHNAYNTKESIDRTNRKAVENLLKGFGLK